MIRSVRVEARANGTTVETIEVTYRSAPQHNHNVYEVACPVCAERFVAAGAHPELGYDELGDIGQFDSLTVAEAAADDHDHDRFVPSSGRVDQ